MLASFGATWPSELHAPAIGPTSATTPAGVADAPRSPAPAVIVATESAIVLPPRPAAPLGRWSIALPVPLIRQIGDKSNCGPTAAAMALGAYEDLMTPAALRDLRNAIGEWTWQRFPRRQRAQDGSDAGGTTRLMMQQSLDRFGSARWQPVSHTWLPREVWALIALKRHLAERRPLVVLAEASPLWGHGSGLHWVVATGLEKGRVRIHDPADGRTYTIALERFWRAWRLPARFHRVPGASGFEGLVADRSLPAKVAPLIEERHLAHEARHAF